MEVEELHFIINSPSHDYSQAMITVRGLAAKQIAYTITQIPLVYFHIMSMSVSCVFAQPLNEIDPS